MYLNRSTAKRIIEEVSEVLDYDINIMDESGSIIASTDINRVDTFHEAAYRILSAELHQLIVYYDEEYKGCKRGINLPIIFNQKIIGVVGITGDVDEINKYARILKKMTEILASDLFTIHQENIMEKERIFFFHEWLRGNLSADSASLDNDLKKYGLRPDMPFVVAIITPEIPSFSTTRDSSGINIGGNTVIIANAQSSTEMHQLIQKSYEKILSENSYIIAIGSVRTDYTTVEKSFNHAVKLIERNVGLSKPTYHDDMPASGNQDETATAKSDGSVWLCYDEQIRDIILDGAPSSQKEIFLNNIFGNCNDAEREAFQNFMRTYCDCNGSIQQIAERLFVHKNTVQYRILKIKEKTGKDPRITNDLIDLFLASKWDRKL